MSGTTVTGLTTNIYKWVRIKGGLKWHGKQGRLEIFYDDVDEVWRGFMAVEVEKPHIRGGGKPPYIAWA